MTTAPPVTQQAVDALRRWAEAPEEPFPEVPATTSSLPCVLPPAERRVGAARGERLAEETSAAGRLLADARRALVTATAVSVADSVPRRLIVKKTRSGAWTSAQAVALLKLLTESSTRTYVLRRIGLYLSPAELAAVEAMRTEAAEEGASPDGEGTEKEPEEAPLSTPRLLSEPGAGKALARIAGIGGQLKRSGALVEIAPSLPPAALPRALQVASSIEHPGERAEALLAVALRLPEEERQAQLEGVLAIAAERPVDIPWGRTLVTLAARGPTRLRPAVVEAAEAIDNEWRRAGTLVELLRHLPESEHDRLIRSALDTLAGMASASTQSRLGRELSGPLLQMGYAQAALDCARRPKSPAGRSALTLELLHRLPDELQPAARQGLLDDVQATRRAADQLDLLTRIAPRLTRSELRLARDIAETLDDPRWRDAAVERIQLKLDEGAAAAATAGAPAVTEPAHAVPAAEQHDATALPALDRGELDKRGRIRDADLLADVGLALAPHLPPALVEEVLETQLDGPWLPLDLEPRLAKLAPALTGPMAEKAIESIVRNTRASAAMALAQIAALAPALPESWLEWAMDFAIEQEFRIPEGHTHRDFPLPRMVEMAYSREDAEGLDWWEGIRARAIQRLASRIQETGRLPAALRAVIDFKGSLWRSLALAGLAPDLPAHVGPLALETTLLQVSVEDPGKLLHCIRILGPHLTGTAVQETVQLVPELPDPDDRCRAWLALAPCRHGEPQVDAVDGTRRAADFRVGLGTLAGLAPHLPRPLAESAAAAAVAAARKSGDEARQRLTLPVLAPLLPEAQRQEILGRDLPAAELPEIVFFLARLAPEDRREGLIRAVERLESVREVGPRLVCAEILAPILGELPAATADTVWRGTLEFSARRGRRALLSAMKKLGGHAAEVGGGETAAGLYESARDICRWWP